MLCEKCKKRSATAHIKQTINGKTSEAYLCSECYSEISDGFPSGQGLYYSDFGFGNFFDSLLSAGTLPKSESRLKKCDFCGSTFEDIARIGRVGCHKCYSVFSDRLRPTLEKIHGKDLYKGQLPKSASDEVKKQRELDGLKKKLEDAINNQEFETAAKLRDEIRATEGKE